MKINLNKYSNLTICVAVSGGKDSMALLHYLHTNCGKFGIKLCALNCDHGMRGEESARDSKFVKDWCDSRSIPIICFKANGFKSEGEARAWRLNCYAQATQPHKRSGDMWQGADAVATAHHLNDNAETVLFNLARGSSLGGMTGITDFCSGGENGTYWRVIHPLVECSRADIDEYIEQNAIEYVTDSTNLTDDYTRNYIRHNVLPALEKAVPQATRAIFRFSRLAAEDEEYFAPLVKKLIKNRQPYGYEIARCEQKVIFRRAVIDVVANKFGRKDYTYDHAEKLYNLQFLAIGKKFEFLGLTAFNEGDKIVIADDAIIKINDCGMQYDRLNRHLATSYCGQYMWLTEREFINEDLDELENSQAFSRLIEDGAVPATVKVLEFDRDLIPLNATIRFKRAGDRFTKFGGGTKSLGDYLTDKKIPQRLRGVIPLVVSGENEVLIVCGVEISDGVKVTGATKNVGYLICADYSKL